MADSERLAPTEKSTDDLVLDGVSYSRLDPKKHGVGGIVKGLIKEREQDKEARPLEGYMVVWFPKVEGIGNAFIGRFDVSTFSQTPHAAIAKFMDPWCHDHHQSWAQSEDAGMKVIKVRISQIEDTNDDHE